jgi:hypothetical protein
MQGTFGVWANAKGIKKSDGIKSFIGTSILHNFTTIETSTELKRAG